MGIFDRGKNEAEEAAALKSFRASLVRDIKTYAEKGLEDDFKDLKDSTVAGQIVAKAWKAAGLHQLELFLKENPKATLAALNRNMDMDVAWQELSGFKDNPDKAAESICKDIKQLLTDMKNETKSKVAIKAYDVVLKGIEKKLNEYQ